MAAEPRLEEGAPAPSSLRAMTARMPAGRTSPALRTGAPSGPGREAHLGIERCLVSRPRTSAPEGTSRRLEVQLRGSTDVCLRHPRHPHQREGVLRLVVRGAAVARKRRARSPACSRAASPEERRRRRSASASGPVHTAFRRRCALPRRPYRGSDVQVRGHAAFVGGGVIWSGRHRRESAVPGARGRHLPRSAPVGALILR